MPSSSSIKYRAAILASSLALISTPTHARSTTTTTTNNIKQPLPPRRKMPYLNSNNVQQIINEASIKNKDKDPSRALLNNMESNWMSLEEGIEFIPLLNVDESPVSSNSNRDNNLQYVKHPTRNSPQGTTSQQGNRKLNEDQTTGGYDENNAYSVQPFVPGLGKYDEYAQAWRLLGFMIDCNEVTEDDDYAQDNGSNDGGTEEGCTRYLLWAAYVDTEYTDGCGIGEYQQWDRFENKWDTTPCDYAPDGCNRCAKMDCHLENTHFSILGFFKHKNWDDWMEQLFKHEGICVWSDEEYAFMQNARGVWPHGCIDTGKTNDNGDELYYNVRPSQNGRMAVGLYTDVYCKEDYPADTYEIETLVGNIFQGGSGGSGDYSNYDWSYEDLEESQARWDSAFDAWHICHPCVAHDLENTGGDKYSCNDDDGGGRRLGGEGCETGEAFSCYDDAGYTNVNQCMKFSAKTIMKTATFRDIYQASNSGVLADSPLSGFIDSSKRYHRHFFDNVATWAFLIVVSFALIISLWNLYKVSKRTMLMPKLRETLLDGGQGGAVESEFSEVDQESPTKASVLI